jgi:hypothetical protein
MIGIFRMKPSDEQMQRVTHSRGSLADWSDEDIAREHHWRQMRKLGDQRTGVSVGFMTAEEIAAEKTLIG